MLSTYTRTKRGFTLIELLVVIAIIGILSSVVLASLGTARQKARDATRISDMKNIQLALELYYDSLQSYPANSDGASDFDISDAAAATNVEGKLVPTYIPRLPSDPQGAAAADFYRYVGLTTAAAECTAATGCASYAIGATLETANNVLGTDNDNVAIANGLRGLGIECGDAADGTAGPAGSERCYSLRP